jgi:hemolysin activation/secretion protein
MVWSMRYLTAVLLLAAATPAVAQPTQIQLDDLRMQQQEAQRRAIDQSNQLTALETRLRAEQAAADLERPAPRVPEMRYKPAVGGFTRAMPPTYPSVPDTTLADSNRKVQDATRSRR